MAPEPSVFNWVEVSYFLLAALVLLAAFKMLRVGIGIASVARLLKQSMPIRRHGKVTIAFSDSARVPFSILVNQAWVILPTSLLSSRTDFRIAVAHELQHHRQRDTVWIWFFEWFPCFFPLNPFVRRWRKAITEKTLAQHLEKLNAEAGFAIVADPNNGQILAVANIVRKCKPRAPNWALGYRSEPA